MNTRVGDGLEVKEAAPVESKGFKCPNCGGPINLALPGKSQTVRCTYCCSILEPQHEVLQLKEKYNEKFSHKMWIPLSAEGTLGGIKFKCVGMVVRNDDSGGEWSEYLLFNPYHGYRFLVESSGHWTLIEQAPGLGFDSSGRPGWYGPTGKIKIGGEKLKYFTHYQAHVKTVIGEFPWQVTLGETNDVTEYINPPYAASCETVSQYFDKSGKKANVEKLLASHRAKVQAAENSDDDEEIEDDEIEDFDDVVTAHGLTKRIVESNWSTGEYQYPEQIQAAFNLTEMPERVGFGMCEPNPAKRRFLFSLAWSALLFLATSITCTIVAGGAEEKQVLAKDIQLNTADFELKSEAGTDYLEFGFEPGMIELTKATNVEFDFRATLNQQWMSLNVFMINEATGDGFIYADELSHYWGGSGDDTWREGGDSSNFTTKKMPAGTYFLYVAGATNIGADAFKRNIRVYGTRPAEAPQATTDVPKTTPIGAKLPTGAKAPAGAKTPVTAKAPAPVTKQQVAEKANPAEKRGQLLPLDFFGKASQPKFDLRMKAKRDVSSVGMGGLFIFILLCFNVYYYIRYRQKEGER